MGLVELTRHRQGQSLAEIFTKKCPHCQGSGCSVIDFNFATPVAEGEYRAKQAKVKLPSGAFKKNKYNNKNSNLPKQEQQVPEESQKIEIETTPETEAVKKENNKRNKRTRTKKQDQNVISEINSEVIEEKQQSAEIILEEEKPKTKRRRTTKKTKSNEETVVQEKVEEPKKKAGRPNRGARTKTSKKAAENE